MQVPFSIDDFLGVFAEYHRIVPWAPTVAFVVAVGIMVIVGRRGRLAHAWLLLGVLWGWMGLAYHLVLFSRINPAARLFGVVFVGQAALFGWLAWRQRSERAPDRPWFGPGPAVAGLALVAYPLAGQLLGHRYPFVPTFGLPCPTTIFTLGVLAWIRPRERWLLVIPGLWAVVGTSAAVQLGMWQDLLLPLSAGVAAWTMRTPRARPLQPDHLPRPRR